jgi:predicted DCC family thiol-disulfide oxidoreductase YuxK
MPGEQPLVLFDGVCNFCNYWVNFAIRKNKKNNLRFTPIQGETASRLLPQFSISTTELSSVIFINNGKVYTQSSAALQIARHLKGGWKLIFGLYIIPKFIRDFVYNIIAKNRYKWFGKANECMLPSKEIKEKFLP